MPRTEQWVENDHRGHAPPTHTLLQPHGPGCEHALSHRLCGSPAVESLPPGAGEPSSHCRTQPRGLPGFWAEGQGLPLCAVELRVKGRAYGLPPLHPGLAHNGVPGRREMRSRLAHQTPALAWVWLSELESPLEITSSPRIEAQRGQWICTGSHSKAGRTPMGRKHILEGSGLPGQFLVKWPPGPFPNP